MAFVELQGPQGRLEGLVAVPEAPSFAALMLHPHPLHGGTMHNHVTYRAAKALEDAGGVVLRFNFRGVGRSAGSYGDGDGELEDARAALGWLSAEHPSLPLWAGGFSFGSRTALQLAAEGRVGRVLAVGVPLTLFDFGFARGLGAPVAFVHADRDEVTSLEDIESFVRGLGTPTHLEVISESDHLCTGRLDACSARCTAAVGWLMQQTPPGLVTPIRVP